MVATRTVRLDDEAEAVLQQIRDATGLPISEALKQGLQSLKQRVGEESRRSPYDIYRLLDLGPGGGAIDPRRAHRNAERRRDRYLAVT